MQDNVDKTVFQIDIILTAHQPPVRVALFKMVTVWQTPASVVLC